MTEKDQNKKKPDLNETAFNIAKEVTEEDSIKSDKDVDKKKPSN